MLLLKYLLSLAAMGMFAVAVAILTFDVYLLIQYRRLLAKGLTENLPIPRPIRWLTAARLAALALVPLVLSQSLIVVPSGSAGVRVSQISGTLPGTLYPGVHLVKPFIDSVVLYETRDMLFTTAPADMQKRDDKLKEVSKETLGETRKPEQLKAQAREGLAIGLEVTVRYKLDPARLDFIHKTVPQPVELEVVPPVVASAFRELVPNYTVREVFATKREEIRGKAAGVITKRLAADGVIVKEVMLRDIQLPVEYAKGLEGLLLKEQEAERMGVETEIQQKQAKISELEAEQQRVQQVKQAEGAAQVRVLQAKGESDAMQYMLPLKEKQIQQSRLEAEAHKEATVKNAEAAAQAKVIDSKAEMERRKLLAEAEANRIRVTASADAERLRAEAQVLKQNPLLINKIVAERLSDKIQIMMVPADGKFFLGDILRGANANVTVPNAMEDPNDRPASDDGH
jgi:regulator of protease activity HflC (stomatin/prohibitin superfamily)